MRRSRGIVCIGVTAACMLGGWQTTLWAVTLRINQPKVEATAKPGEVLTGTVEVENLLDEPVSVQAYLQDWRYVAPGDGSKEFAPANTLPLSCADWVSFFPQQFELEPRGKQAVGYTIRIPPEARGSAYAVLFFETLLKEAPGAQPGVTIRYTARLGSLIWIEIEGSAQRAGALSDLEITPPQPRQPLRVRATFTNSGSTALVATGYFHITDAAGQLMARGVMPTLYTHPGLAVPVEAEWMGRLPAGTYTVLLTLDLGGDQALVDERTFTVP